MRIFAILTLSMLAAAWTISKLLSVTPLQATLAVIITSIAWVGAAIATAETSQKNK